MVNANMVGMSHKEKNFVMQVSLTIFLSTFTFFSDYIVLLLKRQKNNQYMVNKLTVKTEQNLELFKFEMTAYGYGKPINSLNKILQSPLFFSVKRVFIILLTVLDNISTK